MAALELMMQNGLPADRLESVSGLADTRPLYPESPGDHRNRRVSILIKAPAPMASQHPPSNTPRKTGSKKFDKEHHH